jgi:ferritin-like metal-binding protein YciE
MKTKIQTIEDAFVFYLQQLIFGESRIREGLFTNSFSITSAKVKHEIKEYEDSSYSKLLKLERVFNYLMREPFGTRNQFINQILLETTEALAFANKPQVKDILVITAFKNINAWKVSNYKNAYIFSVELELDTPSDLLQEILEWELGTGKILSRLAIEEFNNMALPELKGL